MVSGSNIIGRRRGGPRRGLQWSAEGIRWLVLVLVALGALLRFYRLDVQSLWVDEVLTLGAAEVGGRLGAAQFFGNVQGPLHALLVHLVARFSDSTFALRSISAVAGTALIPVTYLLGKSIVNRAAGVVSALLVAVSPFAIWYSQEIRNYSLLMFLTAVASLLIWRLVTERRRSWWPYVLAVALAVYCNLSAVFLALAHALFAVPRAARDRAFARGAVLAFAVAAALCAPMVWGLTGWAEKEDVTEQMTFAPSAEETELRRGDTTFTVEAIPYSVFAMGYGFSLGPGLRELHSPDPSAAVRENLALVAPAGALLAVGLLLGLWSLARRRRRLSFVLLVMLVVLAASAALAILNIKPMNPRYLAVAFPILIVTLAAGIVSLPRVAAGLLCAAIVVFCCLSLSGYYLNPRYWKADVRSAAYYVQLNEEPGDIVLVPVVRDVFNHYYDGAAERFVFYRGQAGSDAAVRERLEREAGGAARLWYVEAREWEVDPDGRIPSVLRADHPEIDAQDFTGVSVTLFRMRGEGVPRDGVADAVRDTVGADGAARPDGGRTGGS